MINKESIISIFDDKPTLLQWLKKVEAALNNASAVSFNVNKRGNATLTLSIVFEDGSEIESNEFVLEQGESVQSAEVVNGVLYFTLTNGDVLNAGNILNGNITISGNLTATGALNGASAVISGNVTAGGDVEATGALKGASAVVTGSVTAGSVATSGGIVAGGGIAGQGLIASLQVSTPKLTTLGTEIAAEKPIVEVMIGYAFRVATITGLTITPLYFGVAKNGNKLTIALSFQFSKSNYANDEANIIAIDMPSTIGNKLVPYSLGWANDLISSSTIDIFSSTSGYKTIPLHVRKFSNSTSSILLSKLSELVDDTTYICRKEITFLLSENLAA